MNQQALADPARRAALASSLCSLALVACAQPKAPAASGADSAVAALEAALRGYERESLEPLQALLPPNFVGRAALLEAARKTLTEQSQIRVQLSELKTSGDSSGPSSIYARWDKRFIKTAGGQAMAESGTLNAVLRRQGAAWAIESLSTDNPFVR